MIPAFFCTYSLIPQDTVYMMTSGQRKSTLIQTTTGMIEVPLSIKTVLKKYQLLSCLNPGYTRSRVTEYTGKKILAPLPILPGIVLMPVKTRFTDDGESAYGYVNLHYTLDIVKTGIPKFPSRIVFHGPLSLLSPQSVNSLENNLRYGRYVQKDFFAKCAEAGILYEIQDPFLTAMPGWEPV